MKNIRKATILLVLIFAGVFAYAQIPDSVTAVKKADKWVKSQAWAKGLKIKADPSINSVEFEKQYEANPAMWDKVFNFLGDSKLATMTTGKYPIEGTDAYATIADGTPKKS